MTKDDKPELSPGAEKAYDRMLSRVQERLAEAEYKTWQRLQDEIEEAVEFEQDLKEFTREELNLLAAYLRRDLSHLLGFVSRSGKGVREWLYRDLERFEDRVLHLLFSIADPTRLDTLELQQKLEDQDPEHYFTGEIATAGVLRCVKCGYLVTLPATVRLEPCHQCESHYFERITAHTPDVDPQAV